MGSGIYIDDLKDINIIVLSKSFKNASPLKRVWACGSVEEVLETADKNHFTKIFVSGGAATNNSFFRANVVDKLILNYNPYVINKGIGLFDGEFFVKELELEKVVREKEGILQVHYRVKK